MLLTSPLVITVGLSLTIPLSLLGQMILNSQTSSVTYWIGAGVVLLSFVSINYESKVEEKEVPQRTFASGNSGSTGTTHINHTGSWLWKLWNRINFHGQ